MLEFELTRSHLPLNGASAKLTLTRQSRCSTSSGTSSDLRAPSRAATMRASVVRARCCSMGGPCGHALRRLARLPGAVYRPWKGWQRMEGLHPLQSAFIEVGAVQCGYCTPGMLMAAKGLLDRTLEPTREEIVDALEGNLCRCTGYKKIVEAVELAAQRMRVATAAGVPPDTACPARPKQRQRPSLAATTHARIRPARSPEPLATSRICTYPGCATAWSFARRTIMHGSSRSTRRRQEPSRGLWQS